MGINKPCTVGAETLHPCCFLLTLNPPTPPPPLPPPPLPHSSGPPMGLLYTMYIWWEALLPLTFSLLVCGEQSVTQHYQVRQTN